MEVLLEVNSDLSERVHYSLPGFPLLAFEADIFAFHQNATACHWHPDLEFVSVTDGIMNYFVSGQTIQLQKGDGLFVNSKRLHYNFSQDSTNCTYKCVVVSPSLLSADTLPGKVFFESKFGIANEDYCVLKRDVCWQKEVMTHIAEVCTEMKKQTTERNLLRLLSQAVSLCLCVSENIRTSSNQAIDGPSWMVIWNMTGYIQKNYAEKITLDDIAAAGQVCRSRCCQLFNKHIGQSPVSYLQRYRVNKSCQMLTDSSMTIIEIALACGFQSSNYFTQVFKKEIGATPKDYRKLTRGS